MQINWNQPKRQGTGKYPIYPDGTYKVHIRSYETVEAKTGTTQIRWRAEIEEPAAHYGGSIIDHCALTEKALWKLTNFVGCHIDTKQIATMEVGTPAFFKILDLCIGRTMYWRVSTGTNRNTGKPRNDVEEYLPDPTLPLRKLDESTDDDVPEFLREEQQA